MNNIVSSAISSVTFHREARIYSLYSTLCLFLFIVSFNYSVSLWSDFKTTEANLKQELQSCLKKSEEYNLLLDSFEQDQLVLSDKENFLLFMEKNKYESLKKGNDTDILFLNQKIDDYNSDSSKIKRWIVAGTTSFLSFYFFIFWGVVAVFVHRNNSKVYSECQSCGRTVNSVLMNYGTEMDKTLSRCFCNKCYRNGLFLDQNLTPKEMEKQILEEMACRNFPQSAIVKKIKRVKKLKRWEYYNRY